MKIPAKVNRLECSLCKAKDTGPDPVAPQCRALWAHYVLDNGSGSGMAHIVVVYMTQGLKCAYCDRTGKARFNDYKTMEDLKADMGSKDDVCQTFHSFRKWWIQRILELRGNVEGAVKYVLIESSPYFVIR